MQPDTPDLRRGMADPQAIPITRITIEDNTIYDDQTLIKMMGFTPGDSLDPDRIEESIARLYSSRYIFSGISLGSATFHDRVHHQPSPFLSFSYGTWIGYSRGKELPWGYWYSPNRFDPLHDTIRSPGSVRYELSARNVKMITAGLQLEPIKNWFINLDSGAGRFMNEFHLSTDIAAIDYTLAVRLGALTLVGPIEFSVAHASKADIRAELRVLASNVVSRSHPNILCSSL